MPIRYFENSLLRDLVWFYEGAHRAQMTQSRGVAVSMRITLGPLLKILLVVSCISTTAGRRRRCSTVYEPVCTSDGRTHLNRCHAANWIKVLRVNPWGCHQHECSESSYIQSDWYLGDFENLTLTLRLQMVPSIKKPHNSPLKGKLFIISGTDPM